MRKVVIFGATSAIATATARLLTARGYGLFLAGRNADALQALVDDLRTRGGRNIHSAVFDAGNIEGDAALLHQANIELGGYDTVIVAYGTLPDQALIQDSPERVVSEIGTNFTSAAALLTLVAAQFEKQGSGTIVAISSVAGDRGRAVNYVYGSAKAGLTCFLSGLRQRLAKKGIDVITVKPGFVDTPMTAAFPKGALWSSPERIGAGIVHAIENRRWSVYLPGYWRLIMLCIRMVPERIFVRLKF